MKTQAKIFASCTAILTVFGLVCLYSASYPQSLKFGYEASYFFKRQLVFALVAGAAACAVFFIPMKFFKSISFLLLGLCLIFMLMSLFTRFGKTRLGGRRWLSIGPLPSFQPAELVKFSSVLFIAKMLGEADEKNRVIRQIICFAVCLGFGILILMQKDYSNCVVYLGVCLAMIFLSGLSLSWVFVILCFLLVCGAVVLFSEPYRVKRIAAFLHPSLDPAGINYQVMTSRKALQSGGLFGKGLGLGSFKNGLLPEVENDFILANIAEETGLLGVFSIFGLFAILGATGFKAARRIENTDGFSSFLAFGFSSMIVWQALVNAAVVSGLLPPTGIPLPFFSQGGTNLLVVITQTGFLFKIISMSEDQDDDEAKAKKSL